MSNWIFQPRVEPAARLRLFCFPYAGAGATLFQTWPDALPPEVELCAVQPPGRELRIKEQPFSAWEPLVAAAAEAMEPYLDRPFALLGYCVGSIVAFEVARHLRRRHNKEPIHLFIAARGAPRVPEQQRIHELPDAALIAHLKETGATPPEILSNPGLLNLLLPTIRADFQVDETYGYTPGEPLSCDISTFRGAQDQLVSTGAMAGWQEETTGRCTARVVPGGHFFINSVSTIFLQMVRKELQGVLNQLPVT